MTKIVIRSVCVLIVLMMTACSSLSTTEDNKDLSQEITDLKEKTAALEKRQEELARAQGADIGTVSSSSESGTSAQAAGTSQVIETVPTVTYPSSESTATTSTPVTSSPAAPVIPGIADLPSNPQPGECYAHVWSKPLFNTVTESIKTRDEEEVIEVIPAQYKFVMEKVQVREASTRIVPIPATYATVEEPVEIKPAERTWYIGDRADSPRASAGILAEAEANGFNLSANEKHGVCFHEHYYAAKFEDYSEQVLIKEATERIDVVPARYGMVEKRVLIEPEREKIIPVPAVYQTVTEQIVDSPARNEWQQCGGSDQVLNQVMCFVQIPETYKTITRRNLKSPATTRIEIIPARYEMVSVNEVIEEAREVRTVEPAQYAIVSKQRQISEPTYAWHEVHGGIESPATRTGRTLCFRETPAEFRVVTRQKIVTPATSKTLEIPAEYRSVQVQKLLTPEQAKTSILPAQYETISRQEMVRPGRMEWRAILCEADYNPDVILRLQQALSDRGYPIKKIDGKFGEETLRALNQFQEDNGLPVDSHINLKTIYTIFN